MLLASQVPENVSTPQLSQATGSKFVACVNQLIRRQQGHCKAGPESARLRCRFLSGLRAIPPADPSEFKLWQVFCLQKPHCNLPCRGVAGCSTKAVSWGTHGVPYALPITVMATHWVTQPSCGHSGKRGHQAVPPGALRCMSQGGPWSPGALSGFLRKSWSNPDASMGSPAQQGLPGSSQRCPALCPVYHVCSFLGSWAPAL